MRGIVRRAVKVERGLFCPEVEKSGNHMTEACEHIRIFEDFQNGGPMIFEYKKFRQ